MPKLKLAPPLTEVCRTAGLLDLLIHAHRTGMALAFDVDPALVLPGMGRLGAAGRGQQQGEDGESSHAFRLPRKPRSRLSPALPRKHRA